MSAIDPSGTDVRRERRLARARRGIALAALLVPSAAVAEETASRPTSLAATMPVCVFVSSYHRGYSWSDRLENGLRERVGERCRIVRYDLDSKRRKDPADIERAAGRALEGIRRLDADVVLTADDNAIKYLVRPHLADGPVPVVFSGVNWTVEEYGLPTPSVTGIVEVAPIGPMIRQATGVVPAARRAVYVGASTLTETKNFERIRASARRAGIELEPLYASDLDGWRLALELAQDADFVVIGSFSGIAGWDAAAAAEHALAVTRRPSFTNHDWMMPFAAVGYTKIPEEHGEWAGACALAILDGLSPADIPLVTNRKWDTWVNEDLVRASGARLPATLLHGAKRAGAGS